MHLPLITTTLAEAANGITQITQTFGVDFPSLASQVISFCVVAWLLWRFAFKPVLGTLDQRQKKIETGIAYAEQMKIELAAARQQQETILQEAQVKARQIIADTQKASKDYADKQQQEATAKAADIVVKARQSLALEQTKMLADARSEIARLVVATTQRVLAKRLTDADKTTYNDTAVKELAST
jgi:F-type H+-transporting ATPase subunit b